MIVGRQSRVNSKFRALLFSPIITLTFGYILGFDVKQIIALSAFVITVLGAFLYWQYKLVIAFVSVVILFVMGVIDVETFIKSAEFNIILFLVAISILVAPLKRVGFFRWFSTMILSMCKFNFKWFLLPMSFAAMFFACLMDEVSSIIFMSTIMLEVAQYFEFNPTLSLLLIIMSTNIGSSGTALGNPVGLIIAFEAGLKFSEFLRWSMPIGILSVAILYWYFTRKRVDYISSVQSSIDKVISERGVVLDLASLIGDFKKFLMATIIFIFTVIGVASHGYWEHILGLEDGTMLLGFGFLGAAAALIMYREEAKEIVEGEVDWWSLLFIAFILGEAGALKYTGVTVKLASMIMNLTGGSEILLFTLVSLFTFSLSPFIDNISIVATLTPIVLSLKTYINVYPVWWIMLISACYAGNITPLGAAANIIALGQLNSMGMNVELKEWIRECTIPTIIVYGTGFILLLTQFFLL
ncbi:MAG: SLC13 family permease [Candidatus Methanomethylicia archaeon]